MENLIKKTNTIFPNQTKKKSLFIKHLTDNHLELPTFVSKN